MSDLFNQPTVLNASTARDGRGLGLIELRVTQSTGGQRSTGRVNAQGGITYVGNGRDLYGAPPAAPTLILSTDESRIIANALFDHLHGMGGVFANQREVNRLKERLEGAERQNELMRKGKKAVEQKLKRYEELERALNILAKYGIGIV